MNVRSEIAQEQRKDTSIIKADAELMQSLVKHPGWARYMAMIEAVGQNFNRTLMTPLNDVGETVKTEHAKGALTGLSVAASLPSAKIREASELTKTTDVETEGK